MDKTELYNVLVDLERGNIDAEETLVHILELVKGSNDSNSAIYTTEEEMRNCALGLYRIYWKSGGYSLASVGYTYNGTRWIAPSNWISGTDKDPDSLTKKSMVFLYGIYDESELNGNKEFSWKGIEKMELLHKK